MSSAAGFTTPDSVSEFYGYSCPTTTTTTTVAGFIYTANRYTCTTPSGPCAFFDSIVINNPSSLITAKFYLDGISGYIFSVTSSGGSGPYQYTSMSGAGTNNCSTLCSV
jgi:hypothetical protein